MYPCGLLSLNAGPAMSRCAHLLPATNSCRNAAAYKAPPQRSVLCWARSATLELLRTFSVISSVIGSGQNASPARSPATLIVSTSFSSLPSTPPVSYTHLRAHETDSYLVCRLL